MFPERAMAGSMLLLLKHNQNPVSKFAHFGNMCDVNTWIYSYYGQDPDTKAIIIYLEGFDEEKLMEVAKEISKTGNGFKGGP